MKIRVLTLRYSESLHGFPEELVWKATSGTEILSSREHFYIHGGVPHLTLLLEVAPTGLRQDRNLPLGEQPKAAEKAQPEDPSLTLPPDLLPLYRDLKEWRNARAKELGIPSYAISRNSQLADVCIKLPKTLAELKEIPGYGEATVAKYGQEILSRLPSLPSSGTISSGSVTAATKSERPELVPC